MNLSPPGIHPASISLSVLCETNSSEKTFSKEKTTEEEEADSIYCPQRAAALGSCHLYASVTLLANDSSEKLPRHHSAPRCPSQPAYLSGFPAHLSRSTNNQKHAAPPATPPLSIIIPSMTDRGRDIQA